MYKIEDITKYKYFENADVNFVLDSLTGVVSRQYILEFAKYLIKNHIPFAMGMVDLDNCFRYFCIVLDYCSQNHRSKSEPQNN